MTALNEAQKLDNARRLTFELNNKDAKVRAEVLEDFLFHHRLNAEALERHWNIKRVEVTHHAEKTQRGRPTGRTYKIYSITAIFDGKTTEKKDFVIWD